MFGAHVSMIQRLGFVGGQREDLLYAGRIGNVADDLLVRAGADLLLDFHADGLEIKAHFLEDIDRDALAELDQAEQQMFGADEIMVKAVGLLTRQSEHLLRPGRKIVHGFITHIFRLNKRVPAEIVQRMCYKKAPRTASFPLSIHLLPLSLFVM